MVIWMKFRERCTLIYSGGIKISIVAFDYRDENRDHYSYWIDFDNNQIQKNQTWYDIDAVSSR